MKIVVTQQPQIVPIGTNLVTCHCFRIISLNLRGTVRKKILWQREQ
jgi:hypothetical protein